MAPLYNRYIPPKAANARREEQDASPHRSPPRALGTVVKASAPGLYARYIPGKQSSSALLQNKQPLAGKAQTEIFAHRRHTTSNDKTADEVQHTRSAEAEPARKKVKRSRDEPSKSQKDARTSAKDSPIAVSAVKGSKSKEKQKDIEPVGIDAGGDVDMPAEGEERSRSQAAVITKFKKLNVKKADTASVVDATKDPAEEPEINRLEPIPLPPEAQRTDQDAWSALPSWFAEPISVPHDSSMLFRDLPISPEALKVLRMKDFEKALAVQSGVLPLLLPRPEQHPGDVCVSAATGSGKTLSYVLPIVETIQKQRTTNRPLRAVIIVPTRELVSQVEETCNLFQSSHGLRIGTAAGNRAIKDEQDAILEQYLQYDKAAFEKYVHKLNRSYGPGPLEDDDLDDEGLLLGTGSLENTVPNHVPAYRSRIDLLITTPGRLVDHIRNSPGFTLARVDWLVIDEADRLLDQSFQEWADVVNEALSDDSLDRPPTLFQNASLSGIDDAFKPVQRPPARKVMLSATMTSDLQKLSQLKLRNPKLVLVSGTDGSQDDAAAARGEQLPASGVLTLPSGLEEWAIPVGDGAEKPLYLVALLQQIFGPAIMPNKLDAEVEHEAMEGVEREKQSDSDSGPASESDSDDSSSVSSSSVSSDSSPDAASSASSLSDSNPSSSSESENEPDTQLSTSSTKTRPSILIFTSTNESAARLERLLTHLVPSLASMLANLTRHTSTKRKSHLLSRLRNGSLRVLIATDRASRGLDVPALTDVICYDVPRSVTDYVHRVGRTARAGRTGAAWTFTERSAAGWFWHVVARGDEDKNTRKGGPVIKRAAGQKVRKLRLQDVGGHGMRDAYEGALEKLKGDVLGT